MTAKNQNHAPAKYWEAVDAARNDHDIHNLAVVRHAVATVVAATQGA